MGLAKAYELMLTTDIIDAAEAEKIGLVNKVCPVDSLMEEALQTAKTIMSKGKISVRAAKQAVNNGMNVDLLTGCKLEIDAFSLCLASEDAKEGTTAFLEKRKPDFKGSLKG